MKIIYFCRSGHWAAMAAAIHLNTLVAARRPAPAEIANLPYFGNLGGFDRGFLQRCGCDPPGNEVYIAGFGMHARLLRRVIESTAPLLGTDPNQYVFVDCRPAAGFLSLAGECLWQWLWGPGRGRHILAWIAGRRHRGLAELVERAKGTSAP